MNYILAENIAKTYGIRTLFSAISFSINEGDKIAVVAKNGAGKSTLLKMILGTETLDQGSIVVNKEVQVVLFDQEIQFHSDLSVHEYMMSLESGPIKALRNYHDVIDSGDSSKMQEALLEMERHQAWDLENEMKIILSQLSITNLHAQMGSLSGGQIKRVALAKLLTETRAEHRHVLLIMDEPTNHLDVEMVEWLEAYLAKQKITLLLVTHDRYFLDSVCDTIWEIDNGSLFVHEGSYARYLENKMIREENMSATIDKAQNLYRKELEWMRRQPKARTTKSKSRIEAFYKTEQIATTDTSTQNLDLNFEMKRLGKKILELKHITKTYGNLIILKDFSYTFQRGEKIGIVGPNGAGKSTLLNIIQGLETMDRGHIEVGETITFGYFSQKGLEFDPQMRVIDHIREISENFPLAGGRTISASQFLKLFLFEDQTQYSPIGKLSGGEKRRLHLMQVLYSNPNFLIFDEPTNDLDLPTLTVLENFLFQFQGCLIVVSHDRYFMDRIVSHVLAFEGNGSIKDYPGNFSQYREWKKSKDSEQKKNTEDDMPIEVAVTPPMEPSVKRKLTFKEARELKEIEEKLPILEAEREAIMQKLNSETDYKIISTLSESLKSTTNRLEELELRWLDLQDLQN